MNEGETTVEAVRPQENCKAMRWIDRLGRKIVHARLENLQGGRLIITDCIGRRAFGGKKGLRVFVNVTDSRFYGRVAFGGAIGAAEAYMQGYWTCNDLTRVVQLLLRNRDVLDDMDSGLARIAAPARKLFHRVNRNTKAGSRRNIAAHYDLGNDFFSLWLDPTMMYSAAVFERDGMTLKEASEAKLERICRKLELTADDHVLEIGTGWGGFAVYAARHFGCRVTTTTISREQHEYARARVAAEGLQDRVKLLLEDYRDLEGKFDKLVSIEMIEAVGHEYMDSYFEHCARLLKKDGMMLLQAITIADQRYSSALKSVDFIQRYIFPGGFLPSVTAILASVTRATDLRIYHLEDIGAHYAETLRRWRDAFASNLNRIWSMGYGEEFLRMWHYYYCYCEGAFIERAIGNVQVLFVKPGARRDPIVPSLAGVAV
jgi:cyclopropane-fatty-acyl-phospholipid synthase